MVPPQCLFAKCLPWQVCRQLAGVGPSCRRSASLAPRSRRNEAGLCPAKQSVKKNTTSASDTHIYQELVCSQTFSFTRIFVYLGIFENWKNEKGCSKIITYSSFFQTMWTNKTAHAQRMMPKFAYLSLWDDDCFCAVFVLMPWSAPSRRCVSSPRGSGWPGIWGDMHNMHQ